MGKRHILINSKIQRNNYIYNIFLFCRWRAMSFKSGWNRRAEPDGIWSTTKGGGALYTKAGERCGLRRRPWPPGGCLATGHEFRSVPSASVFALQKRSHPLLPAHCTAATPPLCSGSGLALWCGGRTAASLFRSFRIAPS